jgi:hypothetical protein
MTEKENIDFFNAVKGKKIRHIFRGSSSPIFIPQLLSKDTRTMTGFCDGLQMIDMPIYSAFEDVGAGYWEFVEEQDTLDYEKTLKPSDTIRPIFSDISLTSSCSHPKKYVNRATLKAFWVCPDCKADLGDV